MHGISRSGVKPQDRVVILGDGAIGLMFVAVLAEYTDVILWGGNNQRLGIAEKLGAAKTFNYHQVTDIANTVKELTDGWGADVGS